GQFPFAGTARDQAMVLHMAPCGARLRLNGDCPEWHGLRGGASCLGGTPLRCSPGPTAGTRAKEPLSRDLRKTRLKLIRAKAPGLPSPFVPS
ncbi:unnamed protein product, partial [marine sediment metagenome]